MGILERLGLVRYETTARVHGTTTYKNDPVTYVDDFITGGFWQHDDVLHQAQMMRLNPYAHAVTIGIANSVFEDDWYFVDPEDDEKIIMEDTKDQLKEMEANKWFSLALAGERGHGWTWLYVGTEELQTDTTIERARVLNLDTFTPEYAKVSEWDEMGRPKTLKLKIMVGGGGGTFIEKPIPVEDCILIRNRPYDRTHKGLSITGPIWRALVGTALIGHAVTTYSAKMGMGAPVITTKGAIGTERAAAAEAALEDWSPTRAFVIPNTVVEKFEFIGASGSTVDFGKYHDIFLDEIAEVVRRMNGDTQDYKIYWPVKVAVDEKKQAETRMMNAQADMMEAQAALAKQGRGPNDIMVSTQEKGKDPDKKNNPAGAQAK
jgi:hypothetical protein